MVMIQKLGHILLRHNQTIEEISYQGNDKWTNDTFHDSTHVNQHSNCLKNLLNIYFT